MKKIKKALIVVCCFLLLTGFSIPISGNSKVIIYDIEEIANITIDQTMTYEELLNYYLAEGYSEKEIEILKENHQKNLEKLQSSSNNSSKSGTYIQYALFKMNEFSYKFGFLNNSTCKAQVRLTAGLEFTPPVPNPRRIVSLEGAHLFTGNGDKCSFKGTILYKLETYNSFYYNFYGDFYKVGNMNWNVGLKVGIGESSVVQIGLSNGSGHIKNVSEFERYYSSGIN